MIGNRAKKLLAVTAVSAALLVFIIIVNQVVQFSAFLNQINPILGQVSLGVFLLVLLVAVLTPAYLYIKLPGPLIPPKEADGPVYDQYIRKLSKRLAANPIVKDYKIEGVEDVKSVIKKLDEESDKSIRRTANRAFITTAISQNGALDALFILGLQFRLIWDIAHIYEQRPSLKDLGFLYTNVMVTAFIASSIDEAEYYEIVESSMSQGIGSMVSMVPGTALIVNSAITGSSNAFLTLRIGKVTQQYCGSLVRQERQTIRNSATAKAAKMLAGIVYDGSKKLVRYMGSAPLRMASKPFYRKEKEK
jgi:ABC-type multidrug transport system fused ATPase/permease subunit